MFFVAGPCLIESETQLRAVAKELRTISLETGTTIYLKGSFRKANRTSLHSPQTIGTNEALSLLRDIGREFDLSTVTDVHSVSDVELAGNYANVLQIPAFLSRQTDLIVEASQTGKTLLVKKGQFMAPGDIYHILEKCALSGASDVWICERGTTFGYHDLVVDMRGLLVMKELCDSFESIRCALLFDATHATQQPSVGATSGGERRFALPLARAATAVGVDGLFFETHPDPSSALSDRATQIPLSQASHFVKSILHLKRGIELPHR